jgi:hypothetical protein
MDVGRIDIARTEVGRTGCFIRRVVGADAEGKDDQSRQFVSSNMNEAHKIASFLY